MPTNAMPLGQHYRAASMSHVAHKKRHSGSGRPVLLKKNTSSKSPSRKSASSGSPDQTDEEDMTTSFQQFCATCDNLIVVPNSSILYCSEACRRKDSVSSTPVSPITVPLNAPCKRERDLIPPLSPTDMKTSSFFADRGHSRISLSEPITDRANVSPTRRRPSISRENSEAAKYLSQFHSDPNHTHRPRSPRSHQPTTPSLSGSPTSLTSSHSFASAPASRSLGSGRFMSTRSIELVTPTAALPARPDTLVADLDEKLRIEEWDYISTVKIQTLDDADDDANGLIMYSKSASAVTGAASSSLKQLLHGKA